MLRELTNAQWRSENNMTNHKYLNRRNIKFFEGTFSQLNCRELIIDSFKKRDKKVLLKRKSTNLRPINQDSKAININGSNNSPVKPTQPNSGALLTLPPFDMVNDP